MSKFEDFCFIICIEKFKNGAKINFSGFLEKLDPDLFAKNHP